MSRRRNYSPDTTATIERFFFALDACIAAKLIRNITSFCAENDIDIRHLYTQRKDIGKGYFEVSWLLPLVRKCNISPHWLLTGEGSLFTK